MFLKGKRSRSNKTSLGRRTELKKLPISENSVMAGQRLKDREHKTKRRKSKQTRNKADEENQIQQMTRNFKDAGTIANIPNDASSADQ
jgi:hypothetical protein